MTYLDALIQGVVIIFFMAASFLCGIFIENAIINNECQNSGHSYTDKYYLNCEVKK